MNGVENSGSFTGSLVDALLSYAEDKEKSIDPVQRRWRNGMGFKASGLGNDGTYRIDFALLLRGTQGTENKTTKPKLIQGEDYIAKQCDFG